MWNEAEIVALNHNIKVKFSHGYSEVRYMKARWLCDQNTIEADFPEIKNIYDSLTEFYFRKSKSYRKVNCYIECCKSLFKYLIIAKSDFIEWLIS